MIVFSSAEKAVKDALKNFKSNNIDSFFKDRNTAIDYYTYNNTKRFIKDKFKGSINQEIDLYTTKLTKRLIDRISLVYKKAPVREADDKYQDLIPTKNIKLKQMERIHNLVGTMAVRVKWNGMNLEYEPLLEFEPIFDNGDYLNPVAVVYSLKHPTGSRTQSQNEIFAYWSNDEHFLFDYQGRRIAPSEDNLDMINPYGVMPFVFLHNDPIDEFWTTGEGFDIAEANKQIDQQLTQLAFKLRMSDGILAAEGRVDANNIQIGLNKLTVLEDGRMYSVNPSTNIQVCIEAIKDQLTLLSTNHHLSFDWGVNGNQSGVAIKLNNLELLEAREDDVDKYRTLEKQVYGIERAISEVEGNINLPEDMFINFTEIDFPDPENERAKWDWLFQHNLASPIDYLMSKDAELKKEDAEEIITANKEMNTPTPKTGGLLGALQKPINA